MSQEKVQRICSASLLHTERRWKAIRMTANLTSWSSDSKLAQVPWHERLFVSAWGVYKGTAQIESKKAGFKVYPRIWAPYLKCLVSIIFLALLRPQNLIPLSHGDPAFPIRFKEIHDASSSSQCISFFSRFYIAYLRIIYNPLNASYWILHHTMCHSLCCRHWKS